jgi:predicted membrane protein
VGGYLLTGAGLVLLLKTLGGHSVDVLIGPLILTGVGIFIVLKALKQHRKVPEELQRSEGFLRGNAILSAFKHRHQTQSFRGGELTAIFGGFEVDLRQAVIEGSSARLDTFVMFGGGDLRVPEGWEVLVQATAIFGGVNDKTAPVPTSGEVRPRLVITGLVLFGGIEIRH